MIFDEMMLHNFGVYRSRQVLQLAPPSATKPVVLFGGLNGGGKTTLLDALQLVLYGKLARCSNRGDLGYEEFLRRCIHHGVDAHEGAALEVQFRHIIENVEHTYRVHRSWTANGNGVRECVEVMRNGVFDRVLTEAWHEHVEEFMPVRLAHLFFFDGEQIEAFADLGNSAQLLCTAIHSLLGLDLVDQLTTDLTALERRKQTAMKSAPAQVQIQEQETAVRQLEEQRTDLLQERGAAQNEVERREKALRDVEARFRAEGGDLFEQRGKLEAQRAAAELRRRESEQELRELAAGAAPLLMVRELVASMRRQDAAEETARHADILSTVLTERDARLLAEARTYHASATLIEKLSQFLQEDRKQRLDASTERRYLLLTPDARDNLNSLETSVFAEVQRQALRLINLAEEHQSVLVDLDRQLAAIPDRDAIVQLVEQRQHARTMWEEAQKQLASIEEEIERLTRDCDRKQAALAAQITDNVETTLAQEDTIRILHHSQRVRETLQRFRTAVTHRHVKRIERLILESLHQLLRKQSLITDVKIDPEHFMLSLYGTDGQVLPPDRLSAGERQLLAVSMLWGLGRAAGRPLPAVIDTPLGRLDATHRTHLVERYFPYASHQVLLLSTDEEIDEHYYAKLKPWVGRTYRLEFDDHTGATQAQAGYFW